MTIEELLTMSALREENEELKKALQEAVTQRDRFATMFINKTMVVKKVTDEIEILNYNLTIKIGSATLEQIKTEVVKAALKLCNYNQVKAAEILGTTRQKLRYVLYKNHIKVDRTVENEEPSDASQASAY